MNELLVTQNVIDLAKEHNCYHTVDLTPIKDVDGRVIPHRKALTNMQSGDVYEVVGLGFEPIQPLEVIQSGVELAEASGGTIKQLKSNPRIVKDSKGNSFTQEGYHVYMRIDLPKQIRVPNTDHIIQSRITTDLYQARMTQRTKLGALVEVCTNGMTGWRNQGCWRVRHSKSAHDRIREIQTEIAEMFGLVDKMQEVVSAMVKVKLDDDFVVDFIEQLLPLPKNHEEPNETLVRAREKIQYLAEWGKGNQHEAVKGTMWSLYQGVTEYIDHHKSKTITSEVRRDEYVNFGAGAEIKQSAWDMALAQI